MPAHLVMVKVRARFRVRVGVRVRVRVRGRASLLEDGEQRALQLLEDVLDLGEELVRLELVSVPG